LNPKNFKAHEQLGICYQNGWGVSKFDHKKAIESFKLAIQDVTHDDNNSDAYIALAEYYEEGMHLPKNPKKAFELYKEAAALDNPKGTSKLAESYTLGLVCKQDLEAAELLNKKTTCLKTLIFIAKNKEFASTLQQVAFQIKEHLPKFAHSLNPMVRKGVVDFDSIQLTKSTSAMPDIKQLSQMSAENDPLTLIFLAHNYAAGNKKLGFEQNTSKALELFDKVGEKQQGLRLLADYYREGKVVKRDIKKAEEFLCEAARLGHKDTEAKLISRQQDRIAAIRHSGSPISRHPPATDTPAPPREIQKSFHPT
jgi:TPR repeat protein